MANRLPRVTISGGKEFKELLKGLTDKELMPAARKGLRAVGMKTTRDARRHLHKNHGLDTGLMKKAMGIRALKHYKKEGRLVMFLGPRLRGFQAAKPGRKKPHVPFYIAHLIEFGHRIAVGGKLDRVRPGSPFVTKGTGAVGGFVKAYPFLRPAVDMNRAVFVTQLKNKLREVLQKARVKSIRTGLGLPTK
jgi:hypothetical protein